MRIDDLRPTARIPLSVRERLGIPIPVDVRFGMDPPPPGGPLGQSGGYNYEISAEDRAILEAAVKDTASADVERSSLAKTSLAIAMRTTPVFGAAFMVGDFLANLLGKLFGGSGSIGDVSHVVHGTGYHEPAGATSEKSQNCYGFLEKFSWNVANGVATYEMQATCRPGDWSYYEFKPTGNNTIEATAGEFVLQKVDTLGNVSTLQTAPAVFPGASSGGGAGTYDYESYLQFLCDSSPSAPEHCGKSVKRTAISGQVTIDPSATYRVCAQDARYSPPFVTTFTTGGCKEGLPKTDGLLNSPADWKLDAISERPFDGDPGLSDITPAQTQQLIDEIKKSPWSREYGPPPGQEPAPVQPPAPVGPPHPRNPDWPCGGGGLPGGGGGLPGGGPGGLPGGGGGGLPGGPGGGPGGGLPGLPGGNLPGGPGAGNPPGAPDFPGGPSNVRVPGGPGPGLIEGPPFPCDDARYFPGKPVDVQVGEKTRRGRIGASDCENGVIVPEFPPYGDEYFTKPWCRKNILVVDAVKELAAELGMAGAGWNVDPGCRERWTGCFPKGTSKFDAMWKLADMCGYGVFPPGEEIGPMKPLRIFHGPYHEARDFWGYTAQRDSLDIPSHVEVYRLGVFSVVLEVRTPYSDPTQEKWYSERVGPGVTRSMAYNIALKKQQYFQYRAVAHAVVIPYNDRVELRHQIRLQYPSQGYHERSMIVSYEHEVDMESGAVTKLVVSELARVTFPRRNETFREAWGTLEEGIRIPRTDDRR